VYFSKIKESLKSFPYPIYFPIALTLVFLLALFFSAHQEIDILLANLANALFNKFASFYLWLTFLILIAFVLIGLSPLGKIRIGGQNAKPGYSLFSWFSMLFCTGMGGGILFWGTAEPLEFYLNSPIIKGSQKLTEEVIAFEFAFLHWGLHGWAIYGMTALSISFFTMNLAKKLSFSAFLPLGFFKKVKIRKLVSQTIDLAVIFAVLFGIITSFSMSTISVTSGLNFIFDFKNTIYLKILVVLVITVCYILSSLTGLNKGIKIISNLSIFLSCLLLLCIFIKIPFSSLEAPVLDGIPAYLKNIIKLSLGFLEYQEKSFLVDWTVKYWGWWFAWAPFVGVFIALISRGRTVRQLVFFILITPSVFIIFWFAVFGEAAIQVFSSFENPQSKFDPDNNLYLTLYELFSSLTFPILGLVLTSIFFINSADSATYTISSLTEAEKSEDQIKLSKAGNPYLEEPSLFSRIFWGISFSLLSIVLVSAGGVTLLKNTVSVFVFPFVILLAFVFVNLIFKMVNYYRLEKI